MGSVTDTLKETVDYLNAQGRKVGMMSVHLYRPFSAKYFFKALPKSVKRIAILDRTKELGANGEPLYLDIRDLYFGNPDAPMIIGGRYGLSSKDTTPAMMISVYDNLAAREPKNRFTVGITDDVTNLSLPLLPEVSAVPKGTYQAKFYGIGADGTVGANKNSIMIIGESTDKYCQAYFAYDSKKSGGITVSHLRFGDKPIRSTYLVGKPDFVACHVPSYLDKYDMLKGLKEGGTFLLNTIWDDKETISRLPNSMKKYLAENKIGFFAINATRIAEDIGLGTRTNTIMQSAFFKISGVIPYEQAVEEMRKFIVKSYGRKGEDVVNMNFAAVERGGEVHEIKVDPAWAKLPPEKVEVDADLPDFVRDVALPINLLKGDDLPVSAFLGREDGTFPPGTTQYEKRGIAVNVPEWQPDVCTQCNQCAYVCPHATIRPFLFDDKDLKNKPQDMVTVAMKGKVFEGYDYRIQVSVLDCTGCGNCADICPSKEKALIMKPLGTQMKEVEHWKWLNEHVGYKDTVVDKFKSVKNSQFSQPLFEFSGACAGCGETPYVKLLTQLFGDRMMIANATGCSSIWGGTAPSTPYRMNAEGKGPAWANSLFEDNAEYGFGMALGVGKMRKRIAMRMEAAMQDGVSPATKEAFTGWIASKDDAEASKEASARVLEALEKEKHPVAKEILALKQYLIKKSVWVIGGDGWAYDIGYGGLDHVVATGEDVNMLVLDTEVYSNTGGQSSKSTPIGAVAKFAASGKKVRKKDLGMMALTYGYVYVAQVAMGASQSQLFRAVREAEAYPGPSVIIAYSTCINHGLRAGMNKSQEQMKHAVDCGFWQLYRYNPLLEKEGKNPFQLDSKEPDWSLFQGFLNSEVRYTSLKKSFPEQAAELFRAAEENAKWRYESYRRMAALEFAAKEG
jgi:pyruvate-ferredoxin/flavodoxin oxidoreductase